MRISSTFLIMFSLLTLLSLTGCGKDKTDDEQIKAILDKLVKSMTAPKGLITAQIQGMKDQSRIMDEHVDPEAVHRELIQDQLTGLIESRQAVFTLFNAIEARYDSDRANQSLSYINEKAGPLYGKPDQLSSAQIQVAQDGNSAKVIVLGLHSSIVMIKREGRWYFDADGMVQGLSEKDLQQMQEVSAHYISKIVELTTLVENDSDNLSYEDFEARLLNGLSLNGSNNAS